MKSDKPLTTLNFYSLSNVSTKGLPPSHLLPLLTSLYFPLLRSRHSAHTYCKGHLYFPDTVGRTFGDLSRRETYSLPRSLSLANVNKFGPTAWTADKCFVPSFVDGPTSLLRSHLYRVLNLP